MEHKELRSVAAIYSAVAKFSQNEEPNYVDFYSFALSTKNEKLVQAVLLIPEVGFSKWETLKGYLESYYFGKKEAAESKVVLQETWAQRVTTPRISSKSTQKSTTRA